MKTKYYKGTLFPNNQPIIDLGIIKAKSSKEARKLLCAKYSLSENDGNLSIKKYNKDEKRT